MINLTKGNLLQSDAEALVNTVNTVGVMGKGIALQFKEEFPANNREYIKVCKTHTLKPGLLFAYKDKSLHYGEKLIVNFPTKVHWRGKSQYSYIEQGLVALKSLIIEKGITSIAIPPLGCGNGGLDWKIVKEMIERHLSDLSAIILVYQPDENIKKELQKGNQKRNVELTVARAQLLYALFLYESFGEYSSLFSANKLAYLLQRLGQPLRLDFQANIYGPYAIGVEKVLYNLNGVYLKGLEQATAKPFEPLLLNYEKWPQVKEYVEKKITPQESGRLKSLIELIDGFTSELSLEALTTVDFILQEKPGYTFDEIQLAVEKWSSRKHQLFSAKLIEAAYNRLKNYSNGILA